MKELLLSSGEIALADDDTFYYVQHWKWRLTMPRKGFKQYVTNGNLRLHHVVLGRPPEGLVTDHISGNTLYKQRSNLRHCTQGANNQNRLKCNATSEYKGVALWNPGRKKNGGSRGRAKWRAQIGVENKIVTIGYFEIEYVAAKAYDEAALKYYGPEARLNFPVAQK